MNIRNWSPLWQFALFAVVLLVLASFDQTAKFALLAAVAVLFLQLFAIQRKGT